MGNVVQVKRSSVAGKVPLAADLEVGEIAVNLADGKIFTKDGSGNILELGLSNCVLLSGDQTIAGTKTFTSDIYGTALRANGDATYVRIAAESSASSRSAQVIAKKTTAATEPGCVLINAPKSDLSDSQTYVFGYDGLTSPRPITCPTPAADDNSTKVATTAFVVNRPKWTRILETAAFSASTAYVLGYQIEIPAYSAAFLNFQCRYSNDAPLGIFVSTINDSTRINASKALALPEETGNPVRISLNYSTGSSAETLYVFAKYAGSGEQRIDVKGCILERPNY